MHLQDNSLHVFPKEFRATSMTPTDRTDLWIDRLESGMQYVVAVMYGEDDVVTVIVIP